MTLRKLLEYFHNVLDPIYEKEEVSAFFYILLEHMLGLSRLEYALNPERSIEVAEWGIFESAIKALEQQKPIQYITGVAMFYGFKFKVTPDTLIPRPETEELVGWILSQAKLSEKRNPSILDIGTGSGCIAVSLARELKNAGVTALDVSEEALSIAKLNAKSNGVNLEFKYGDILLPETIKNEFRDRKFDIIVSNPPYVRNHEREKMRLNVLKYEPHTALFVDDNDPLKFYKAIAIGSKPILVENGFLFFEINEALGPEMVELLDNFGYSSVTLKKDLFGKDRMIMAQK